MSDQLSDMYGITIFFNENKRSLLSVDLNQKKRKRRSIRSIAGVFTPVTDRKLQNDDKYVGKRLFEVKGNITTSPLDAQEQLPRSLFYPAIGRLGDPRELILRRKATRSDRITRSARGANFQLRFFTLENTARRLERFGAYL